MATIKGKLGPMTAHMDAVDLPGGTGNGPISIVIRRGDRTTVIEDSDGLTFKRRPAPAAKPKTDASLIDASGDWPLLARDKERAAMKAANEALAVFQRRQRAARHAAQATRIDHEDE